MKTITEDLLFTKKDLAVDLLNSALRRFSDVEVAWKWHATLGYNSVVSDIELEIVNPRYGKTTDFDYTTLVVKEGEYTIIAYYQPGCNSYGYGVLNDEGDVCLEITTFDLVDWILPIPSGPWEKARIELLDELVHEAQKLMN